MNKMFSVSDKKAKEILVMEWKCLLLDAVFSVGPRPLYILLKRLPRALDHEFRRLLRPKVAHRSLSEMQRFRSEADGTTKRGKGSLSWIFFSWMLMILHASSKPHLQHGHSFPIEEVCGILDYFTSETQ